jgi:hypothetical protein
MFFLLKPIFLNLIYDYTFFIQCFLKDRHNHVCIFLFDSLDIDFRRGLHHLVFMIILLQFIYTKLSLDNYCE